MPDKLSDHLLRAASAQAPFAPRAIAILAMGLCCTAAQAQFRYQKIIDSTYVIPSVGGTFKGFTDVAYDGTNVAFIGWSSSGPQGVYLWDGENLTTIARVGADVPNNGGTFTSFTDLALDAGNVAFVATGTTKSGVYTNLGGGLSKVADVGTLVPGTTIPFTDFSYRTVAISGPSIYFNAFGADNTSVREGIYRNKAGILTKVVDRTDVIPNNGNSFIFFDSFDANNGQVFFDAGRGTGGGNGFYTNQGAATGQFRTVMNANTALSGMTNPLSTFSPNNPRTDGTNFAFEAIDHNNKRGLFLERSGVIERIADNTTPNPTSGVPFTDISTSYALSGSNVAFTGYSDDGPTGIFIKGDAGFSTVIHTSNTLDKKDLSGLIPYRDALSGSRVAFGAAFKDGSSGVFAAEPIDTTPGRQSASLTPIFDGQSDHATVSDGSFGVDVVNFPAANLDRRAIMEFNLTSIPATATLKTVALEIQVNLLSQDAVEGPSLAVYGYAGDGVLTAGDRNRTDVFLGESPMIMSINPQTNRFYLDPLAVKQALQTGHTLGLLGVADWEGDQLGWSAKEFAGHGPKLILTYDPTLPGDFNYNGTVDGGDYLIWRKGLTSGYTATDYNTWRSHYGATSGQGFSNAESVPEPSSFSLAIVFAATLLARAAPAATRRNR